MKVRKTAVFFLTMGAVGLLIVAKRDRRREKRRYIPEDTTSGAIQGQHTKEEKDQLQQHSISTMKLIETSAHHAPMHQYAAVETSTRHDPASPVDYGIESVTTSPTLLYWKTWSRPFRFAIWLGTASTAVIAGALVYIGLLVGHRLHDLEIQVSKASQAAIAMQQSQQNGQRAWVGLAEAKVLPLTGGGGGFDIRLQNTGNTPAFDVQLSNVVHFSDRRDTAPTTEPTSDTPIKLGNLMPGASYMTNVWFKPSTAVLDEQVKVIDLLLVSYKDVFQKPHTTKACFYWYGRLSNVRSCDDHNEID